VKVDPEGVLVLKIKVMDSVGGDTDEPVDNF